MLLRVSQIYSISLRSGERLIHPKNIQIFQKFLGLMSPRRKNFVIRKNYNRVNCSSEKANTELQDFILKPYISYKTFVKDTDIHAFVQHDESPEHQTFSPIPVCFSDIEGHTVILWLLQDEGSSIISN
ncbi:hypothetical protein TNCV_1296121 [Trichonephila clavipes]|uniref:Uncharacterized protein n=1 Tax=Trichonephila clavipes TaxID=2585209 RepID=A0A8X6SKN9_TRICX|nr:hypothetical protein TNCV_1296121 [Trichonephila clavipes]